MSVRKAHNSGRNHLRNVVEYYQQIGQEKAQSVIDSITNSYAAEGQAVPNPAMAPPGAFPPPFAFGGQFPPPPFGMPPPGPGGAPAMPPPPGARGLPPAPPETSPCRLSPTCQTSHLGPPYPPANSPLHQAVCPSRLQTSKVARRLGSHLCLGRHPVRRGLVLVLRLGQVLGLKGLCLRLEWRQGWGRRREWVRSGDLSNIQSER
ncbi:hypothetical protein BDW69DRAFT_62204 [Aspergillus filifer]